MLPKPHYLDIDGAGASDAAMERERACTEDPSKDTYICKTQHCRSASPNGLAFNVTLANDYTNTKRYIRRWTPGCTVSYHVSDTEFWSADLVIVKAAIVVAIAHWQSTGLSISFTETLYEEEATFLISYDPHMDVNTFAHSFFPGDAGRRIVIGPLAFHHGTHMSNILSHELGHVLGLRHENWDAKVLKEPNNVHHYPTRARDWLSIMNDTFASDPSLLCLSKDDRKIIHDFYNLPSGSYKDFTIVDVEPTPYWAGRGKAGAIRAQKGLQAGTTQQSREDVPSTLIELIKIPINVWYIGVFHQAKHWALWIWKVRP